jgi:tetratricopeptide (TPR) repeat protein
MKRLFKLLATLLAVASVAHAQEQSGIPAKMTVVTGKTVPVFLQSLSDGKLIFQIYKRPNNVPLGDITKVSRFDFMNQFDSAGVNELFDAGDYQAVVDKMSAELKPSLDEYWQYMSVENNFQNEFCSLLTAYMELGDMTNAQMAASILIQSSNPDMRAKGMVATIKLALAKDNIEEAEQLLESFDSEVGKLYLKACIERARNNPKAAFLLVNKIISEHPNDLKWMPQSEFLNVHLYMDIGLTNSAIQTARQVKNIYGKSNIAADAQKLQTYLEEAQAAAEAAAQAREEEEEKARAEVRARAEARAGIESASTNDVVALPESDDAQIEDTDGDSESETDLESESDDGDGE